VFGKGKIFPILAILVLLLILPVSAFTYRDIGSTFVYRGDNLTNSITYPQQAAWCIAHGYGSNTGSAADAGTSGNGTSGIFAKDGGDPTFWPAIWPVNGLAPGSSYTQETTSGNTIDNPNTWNKNGTVLALYLVCQYGGGLNGGHYFEYTNSTHINTTSPVYANFTVTVISNTTGETIPRASVSLHSAPGVTNVQSTDLYGQTAFPPIFTGGMDPAPMYFNVSKAGYNDTSLLFFPSHTAVDQAFTIYMGDLISGGGGVAQVYVDIADLDDPETGISGAAVGIENTTATINQWYYITATTPTAQFNTTYGGINLSVGQPVIFSAYKEGVYTANNSGTYVIPHTVSHTTLYLKKVSGNATATYQWPVSIVDATTGYTIADSYLNSSLTSGSIWYNRSSPTGKFNVTGTGATGTFPISIGDQITLVGTKDGYQYNWFSLIMSANNNGVTQYINLMPSSALPLNTEFAALVSVYEAGTTKALAGARVAITPGIQNTTTNSVGAAAFQNLTALKTYTATVSKSGYSTTTKTFTGTNQSFTTVDISLSPSSLNPTFAPTTVGPTIQPTVVPTTLPGGNYGGFFGPWYTALHKMGAYDTELNILLTAIIVIIMAVLGAVATGWSPIGFNSGAALGFILCCGFQIIYFWLILAGIAWLLLPLVLRRYTS
jgi:hypothetical protein